MGNGHDNGVPSPWKLPKPRPRGLMVWPRREGSGPRRLRLRQHRHSTATDADMHMGGEEKGIGMAVRLHPRDMVQIVSCTTGRRTTLPHWPRLGAVIAIARRLGLRRIGWVSRVQRGSEWLVGDRSHLPKGHLQLPPTPDLSRRGKGKDGYAARPPSDSWHCTAAG
jgi:hypothetical protein